MSLVGEEWSLMRVPGGTWREMILVDPIPGHMTTMLIATPSLRKGHPLSLVARVGVK